MTAVLGSRAAELCDRSTKLLAHRGLRSRTEYGAGWALGHVRLPIVGLGEAWDQPVARGRWLVGFVGELLDFRERDPSAECDIALAANTWERYGPVGFTEFDGFWSVVAVDRASGEVHCLVDYLSQKPLYVRDDGQVVAVASEPDAVARLAPVELDRTYLSAVVKWGYCPETWRTPYEGVRRMLPGEHLVLTSSGVQSVDRVDVLIPVPGCTPQVLGNEIKGAVRRRVTSADVPVACLLSGGLDSSLVYALASRCGNVRAYHVENEERDACLSVCPDPTFLDYRNVSLGMALDYMQEPLDLGSLVPQVSLSDAVAGSGGERVCLTGDGADELLGGYGRSTRYDSQASDVFHELVAWHLPRLDRVMMRNRVEVRSPYLARTVAGSCLGLPRSARTGKAVLREIARGVIPDAVVDAPKRALRTAEVECDREARSRNLVDMFERRVELCRK